MEFLIFLLLVLLWLFFWRRAEKSHYQSIATREEKYKNILVISDTDLQNMTETHSEWSLIVGETVVALDAFKKFIASLINIFWGRVKSYESLVERARREAVLKVKQQAADAWYTIVVNLRIETSSISKSANNTIGAVEAIAYASGVRPLS